MAADAPQLHIIEPTPAAWDAFVAQHAQGHLLQSSAWGALKASAGWQVQRLAVVGEPAAPPLPQQAVAASSTAPALSAPILAGAQILLRRRYGLSAAYVPRGPLLAADPAANDLLFRALQRRAWRWRAIFLRIEPNMLEDAPQAAEHHSWLLLQAFQPVPPIQPRSSIFVDLTPPPEQLFAALSKGHRADTRRAERQGVAVRVGSAADIDSFYAIMQATGERADFGIHSAAYYRHAWELFQPRSRLLLAEQDGQTVAAHMVFADARQGYYLYSGATRAGLKAGANHLLQWQALQWARGLGCSSYDLWGIPDALGRAAFSEDEQQRAALEAEAQQDALIGVYRFKKGFGGRVVRFLPAYDRVFLPPLYALWRRRIGQ
jgi:lipid II:glycine glycyltransferase (peptidoglycan interpeptide bridge formation enzyme)